MSIFKSAFEKFSIENQQRMSAAVEITAIAVSPGGNLFELFGKMLTTLKQIEKNTRQQEKSGSSEPGVGSAVLMSVIGAKALTGIGKGLLIIADAINKIEGNPEEIKEKLEAVASGINAMIGVGPALIKFAGYLLLATPMLVIGALAAPIFAVTLLVITGALMLASKFLQSKEIQNTLQALGAIGKSIFMFGGWLALSLLVYPFAIMALPMVALVVLGVGMTFYLLDKLQIDKSMKKTSSALAFAAISIVALGASIALFSLIMSSVGDPLQTLLLVGATVLGVGLAFGLIGMFWKQIAKGSLVMILTAIPIILLGAAIAIFANSITPDEKGWITLAQVGAAVTGLGVAMALAGVASVFILPGAAAMVVAGIALISIAVGLGAFAKLFSGGGMDNLLADSGHVTEGFLGFGAGRMMSNMEWSILSIARSFTLPINSIASMYASAPALVLAGVAMLSISKGVKAIQDLNIDYETVPDNIAKLITAVASPFAEFGKNEGAGGRKSLFNRIFGGGSQSPLADGISSVMGIGDALTSIAEGTQAMVDLRFPIYEGTKIVGYNTLQSGFESKVSDNLRMIVNAVVAPFAEIGNDPTFGKGGKAGFFQKLVGNGGQSPIADGISAVQGIGSALTGIAEGVQSMANLTFPIYDDNGKKIGERTITDVDLGNVGLNLKKIVTALTGTFGEIGASPNAKTSWWFGESAIEKGIELVTGMGEPIKTLADGIKTFADEKIDVVTVSDKIQKMVASLNSAFSIQGEKEGMAKNALVGLYKTGVYLKTIAHQVDSFERYTEAFSKYVGDFVKYKDAVNDFDKTNLKLTTDMFQGLSYLAKTEDAITNMSEQLTAAIYKLAEMIESTNGATSTSNVTEVPVSVQPTITPTNTGKKPEANVGGLDFRSVVNAIRELEDRLNQPLTVLIED